MHSLRRQQGGSAMTEWRKMDDAPKDGSAVMLQVDEDIVPAIGYYTVAKGVLTMVDGDGAPVRRWRDGELYTHRLQRGEDPCVIAGRLTRDIRASLRGGSDFNRPLVYPKVGVA
jgi:hypothetical protein